MAKSEQVELLRKMCSVSKANANAALTESGGDIEEAFHLLIVAGAVIPEDLDPDHCTDAHYGLARLPRTIQRRAEASPDVGGGKADCGPAQAARGQEAIG